jgi:gamma-glutamylaminecyclotransferase
MPLIFVYGTLKRGESNNHVIGSQKFCGAAQTKAGYVLYTLDGYPGMVADPAGLEPIRGEVWSVDDACLVCLDALEGTDQGLYARLPVALQAPFSDSAVEAYYYRQSVQGRTRARSDWKA